MFLYAGLVIIGAGIFDMVDGRVARATNQVTQFGGFFDSVIDRYSDVALFFGLLVYYARANRFFYVVMVAFVMVSSVMVELCARPRGVADPKLQGRLHGAAGAHRADHHRRALQSHGSGALGDRGSQHHHRHPPHLAHLSGAARNRASADSPSGPIPMKFEEIVEYGSLVPRICTSSICTWQRIYD